MATKRKTLAPDFVLGENRDGTPITDTVGGWANKFYDNVRQDRAGNSDNGPAKGPSTDELLEPDPYLVGPSVHGIPLGIAPLPKNLKISNPSDAQVNAAIETLKKQGSPKGGTSPTGKTPEQNKADSEAQYGRNKFVDDTAKAPQAPAKIAAPQPNSSAPAPSSPSSQPGGGSPAAAVPIDPLKQLTLAYKVATDPMMTPEARAAAHSVITEHFESEASKARASRHEADFKAAMQIRQVEDDRKRQSQERWDNGSANARKQAGYTGNELDSDPTKRFRQAPPQDPAAVARGQALLDPANIDRARSQTDWGALQGADNGRLQQFQHDQDTARQMRGMGVDPNSDQAAQLQWLGGQKMSDQTFIAHQKGLGQGAPQDTRGYHNTFNVRNGQPMELDPQFLAQQEAQKANWQARGAQINQQATQAGQDSYALRQMRDQAASNLNPVSPDPLYDDGSSDDPYKY